MQRVGTAAEELLVSTASRHTRASTAANSRVCAQSAALLEPFRGNGDGEDPLVDDVELEEFNKGLLSPGSPGVPQGRSLLMTPTSDGQGSGIGSGIKSPINKNVSFAVSGGVLTPLSSPNGSMARAPLQLKNFSFRSTGLSLQEEIADVRKNREDAQKYAIGMWDDDDDEL